MMQKYGYGLPMTRGGVAWVLHEWNTALNAANNSVEEEIYGCAADLVLEWLHGEKTFDGLLCAYFYPDSELTRVVTELCTEGDILLQPHLLMGASCALRLRQRIDRGDVDASIVLHWLGHTPCVIAMKGANEYLHAARTQLERIEPAIQAWMDLSNRSRVFLIVRSLMLGKDSGVM
jgi:hypothetical protein